MITDQLIYSHNSALKKNSAQQTQPWHKQHKNDNKRNLTGKWIVSFRRYDEISASSFVLVVAVSDAGRTVLSHWIKVLDTTTNDYNHQF